VPAVLRTGPRNPLQSRCTQRRTRVGPHAWSVINCLIVRWNLNCTLVQALRLCTGRTAHRGSRVIALPFLDHATRRGGEGSASRLGRSLPQGKTRYTLYRRLGGSQGRSGQMRKISRPPGFDPRTAQPVAGRYTNWATRPTYSLIITELHTGFPWFPWVQERMLRWFPPFQVASTCFSCSPPDLNSVVTNCLLSYYVKWPLPPGDNPTAVNKYDYIIIIIIIIIIIKNKEKNLVTISTTEFSVSFNGSLAVKAVIWVQAWRN
jgi:hypothetical protein